MILNKWYGTLEKHTIQFIMDRETASRINYYFKKYNESIEKDDGEDNELHGEWFPLLFEECPFCWGGTVLNFEYDDKTGISTLTLELDEEFVEEIK